MKYDLKNSIKSLVITIIIVFVGVIKNEFVCIKEYDTSKVVNNNIKDNYIKVDTLAFEANEYSLEDDIKFFVYENYDLFKFYSDTFSISMEDIINELINSNVEVFNYKDIGNTGTEYESLDKNIIDYLFDLEKNKPKLFDNKLVSNTNSNEYIYALIRYYSKLYGNVDDKLLESIAYVESGNLRAKNMMRKNNIFGGMGSNGLLAYKNINYGVLKYVKLMSEKYYGKGLTTLETIGKKYNPVILENGNKVASPKWVSDIKSVMNKFDDKNEILSISDLQGI